MVAIHKMQVNRCRHADCHNRSSIGKKHTTTTTTTTTPPVTAAPTTTTSSASTSGTTTKARPATTRTTTPATQVRFGVDLGGVLWPFMGGELTVPRTLIIIINIFDTFVNSAGLTRVCHEASFMKGSATIKSSRQTPIPKKSFLQSTNNIIRIKIHGLPRAGVVYVILCCI